MIIECPTCRTRFRLDETRIKGKGARVRCRRCGDSIMVIKPEAPEAAPPPPAGGENLFDLRSVVRESLGEKAAAAQAAPPETPPASEFRPLAGEKLVEPPAAEEAPPEAPPTAGFRPLAEMKIVEPPAAEEAPPETPLPPLKDEVDEAFEKFLATAGMEQPPAEAAKEEPAAPPDLPLDFDAGATPGTPAAPPAPAEGARPDFLLSDSDSMDILRNEYRSGESREAFDISASLRREPILPLAEPEQPEPALGASEPAPPPTAPPAHVPADEAPPDTRDVPVERPAARPRPAVREREPSPFLRPSVVVLVLLFLLLAGGGGYLGFTKHGQETLRRLVPGMESLWLHSGGKPGPQYDVRNLIGYYEMNTRAGNLFIIKGQVANVGRSRKSGIRLHAALLDARDQPLVERICYAGNVLAGDTLRTASREKIDETLANRFGDRLVNMDVAPGKSVPFMVVFFNPPEGMNAYRLEAKDGD